MFRILPVLTLLSLYLPTRSSTAEQRNTKSLLELIYLRTVVTGDGTHPAGFCILSLLHIALLDYKPSHSLKVETPSEWIAR